MPTLDYTEFFTNIKANFIHDVVFDEESKTVIRMFTKTFHFGVPEYLPTTLAIDEFRGNAGGQKFQVIVTDPKGKRVLDILPERSEVALFSYFKQFSL